MDILALSTALAQADPANARCRGAIPTVASATSHVASDEGGVNTYVVHVVVVNRGAAQKSNALQSVAVYQNGDKVNEKGIPPLRAGGSYAFDQAVRRSDESRADSTTLRLQLHPVANPGGACYGAAARYRLTV